MPRLLSTVPFSIAICNWPVSRLCRNFLGEPVYNPFDIQLFIDKGKVFDNYWFATGTPTFLIKLIQKNNYYVPKLGNLRVSKTLIDSFDIERIELEPILFQAGYLTIGSQETVGDMTMYTLRFPNLETRYSFNGFVLDYLVGHGSEKAQYQVQIHENLAAGDLAGFRKTIISLFAAVPCTNYVNNTISSYEGYYASVIFVYLASLGLDIAAEDTTNMGRIDLTVKMDNNIYIIEFKVDGEGKALHQIKERNYQQKYQSTGKEIYLIGIDFDSKQRNVVGFEWERG